MIKNHEKYYKDAGMGMVYCLGFIGALVYYMQHANTFWLILFGLFKAVVWPAYVVYGLLRLLGL